MPDLDAPNHHAQHRGFEGPFGFLAALTMVGGRDDRSSIAWQRAPVPDGARLLDLGCGAGAGVRYAARRGACVIGVDPSENMLRLARVMQPTGDYRLGRAEALPLADGSVDVVWAVATVHHWPDVEGGLREAHRVLVPGGRLLVIEAHRSEGDVKGLASHGWTDAQADSFGAMCVAAGFADPSAEVHAAGKHTYVSVAATRPALAP